MEAKQQTDAERVAAIRARAACYDPIGNSAALFLLDRLAAVEAERDAAKDTEMRVRFALSNVLQLVISATPGDEDYEPVPAQTMRELHRGVLGELAKMFRDSPAPVPTPIPDSHLADRPHGADESASPKSASVAVPETKEKP